MNKNEKFGLYVFGLIVIGAIFAAFDNWAWVGLVIFGLGLLGWLGFEVALWVGEKLRGKKKRG